MIGINLLYIELSEMELILRKLFQAVTYNFNGQIMLREINSISQAFSEKDLEKYTHDKNMI
jgi:hypothetical protein